MDTITQALLGGAVGYAVAGKTSRRKAMLWGAAVAIVPDLDVFIPYDNDLDAMTYHRSWTHSWLVHTALGPIFAALMHRFDKTFSYLQWLMLIWLALVTHAGLDALTVYGTQLFWPFMAPPVSGGSVFIIDPFYSIPLLAGFLAILLLPERPFSNELMRYGFGFSCMYLVWGYGAQQYMENKAQLALERESINYSQMQVSATAFNTLLWRVLAVDDDHYYEGFVSIFDHNRPLELQRYNRGGDLLSESQELNAYQRIQWFTNGLFKLEQHADQLVASDLRMGMEPNYFFRFKLADINDEDYTATPPNRLRIDTDRREGIRWVWQRIWNATPQINSESGLK